MTRYLLFGTFFVFSFIFSGPSQAQNRDTLLTAPAAKPATYRYLLLAKAGSTARYRIHIGETITFKRFQDESLRTAEIMNIRGSSFFVAGLEVPLKEVEKIRLRNHTGGRRVAGFGAALLKGAGVVFTLVGGINVLTNLGSQEKADRQNGLHTVAGAALMYGTGVALQGLRKGTYTINEKWTLKVMEMY
ncbi:hypothetical protein [Rufibacter psychrotolerans]|uniref:hypothetical protein n=1 Tax=Rufibacter psychrotolerans TaxID=2812556 RepID=UPI0019684E88|nr:hypothetical protein [Rufibacter sp. SYSU D00308]